MDFGALRRGVIWGVAAFMLTTIHPVSVKAGLIITVIASVVGALN